MTMIAEIVVMIKVVTANPEVVVTEAALSNKSHLHQTSRRARFVRRLGKRQGTASINLRKTITKTTRSEAIL
jgi:hypothetical protein